MSVRQELPVLKARAQAIEARLDPAITGHIAVVDSERCLGCGLCENVCPVDAISIKSTAVVNASRCTGCGRCANECPQGAIMLTHNSGPGYTAKMQPEFRKAQAKPRSTKAILKHEVYDFSKPLTRSLARWRRVSYHPCEIRVQSGDFRHIRRRHEDMQNTPVRLGDSEGSFVVIRARRNKRSIALFRSWDLQRRIVEITGGGDIGR
ncbi:MAG: 4Fe-4S binding protein [Deltaproteobacteria bacterium]|nr:4Fe-4S binding protein [Deltaproteobacteria bacterium]